MRSADPLYIAARQGRADADRRRSPTSPRSTTPTASSSTTAPTVTYNATTAYPWLTLTNTVRAGARATFVEPVVLDYRFSTWRLQPSSRIQPGRRRQQPGRVRAEPPGAARRTCSAPTATSRSPPSTCSTTSSTRWTSGWRPAVTPTRAPTAPARRTRTATASRSPPTPAPGATRARSRLGTLPDIGPRGAATAASLARQQVKEVAAINTMDADVMSLEEVENPVKLGYADRDAALEVLVAALNADYDATHPGEDPASLGDRWAFVPSPASAGPADRPGAGRDPLGVHLQPADGRDRRPRPRSW